MLPLCDEKVFSQLTKDRQYLKKNANVNVRK